MLYAVIIIAVLGYSSAAFLQFRALQNDVKTSHSTQILAIVALLAHGLGLWQQMIQGDDVFIDTFNITSLIALFFGAWLIANGFYRPLRNLYIYLFPISALTLVISGIFSQQNTPVDLSAGLLTHILLSTLAYSFLVLATVQSAVVNNQMARLKQHKLTKMWLAMPPLQTLERVTYELVITGFILLTAAMVSGIDFITQDPSSSLLHKIAFTVLAWSVYGVLLAGHFFRGWRGALMNRWLIATFFVLVLGFFGSRWLISLTL